MNAARDLVNWAARTRAAARHLEDCHLCPHRCGPQRSTASGVCRVGADAYIASEMLHWGEESLLRPAHAIFLSGCTALCTFCVAARWAFQPRYGIRATPAQLAQRIRQRQAEGARSICFIGGEPTPHIPFILAALAELGEDRRAPVVFNSNFYLTDQALNLLWGAVDVFLPDLKFGPGLCGEQIGGMPDYWPLVTQAIEQVRAAGGRLLVRHLVMPGHLACCTEPVLTWLAQRPDLEVSLLTQYVPMPNARGALARPLHPDEVNQVREKAHALGVSLVT